MFSCRALTCLLGIFIAISASLYCHIELIASYAYRMLMETRQSIPQIIRLPQYTPGSDFARPISRFASAGFTTVRLNSAASDSTPPYQYTPA